MERRELRRATNKRKEVRYRFGIAFRFVHDNAPGGHGINVSWFLTETERDSAFKQKIDFTRIVAPLYQQTFWKITKNDWEEITRHNKKGFFK